ncbi:MAG TPA: ABC transporter ATP-binding protein, partial [Vicinamibacteria bacterium]|nr:ABC transporter ATP-binding protein [Vicinamibacteria bacterium]
PTAGTVVIDGQRVDALSSGRLAAVRKRSIGFVFQQYNLFPSLTARENVEYALNIKGLRGRAARDEADRVLDEVGLADRKHFLPRDMSGGQKQRIAVARALAGNPAILLADEPTGNLDSVNSGLILDLFKGLNRRLGQTILMITHNPEAAAVTHRRIEMRDGRVMSPGAFPQVATGAAT